MTTPRPYKGLRRKLVLAFDVGTTYSGISYSILDPGQTPETKGVTKFPDQEEFHGSSKVPSIIYYDQKGNVRAIGAEVLNPEVVELAEDNDWVKAEWFKLHLKPGPSTSITDSSGAKKLPPLPLKKTAVDILADFIEYLLQCSKLYIEETQPNGLNLWKALVPDIEFVLSHPNGWDGSQQSQMRKAAIKAKLVPGTSAGQSRISFVTEGEASLHFALHYGLPQEATKASNGVVIVDAGGGTIDISAYSQKANSKEQVFEEIASPQCHFMGSIFVTISADIFLRKFLEGSAFVDDINHIVQCFDKTTKMRFKNDEDAQFIKFGSTRDNEPAFNIRYGQLKLDGSDVASFFRASIDCIIQAVKKQQNASHQKFNHVVLVGGFSANDWLYKSITKALRPLGYSVYRPDYHVNKAVADGAISYYLNHHVQSRVAKVTLGILGYITYDPTNPEHTKRKEESHISPSGKRVISGVFWVLSAKGTQIDEMDEIRKAFVEEFNALEELCSVDTHLYSYQGKVIGDTLWMDENPKLFSKIFTIRADLSHLAKTSNIQRLHAAKGKYYRLHTDVILQFGHVELKVFIAWKENGAEKRSDTKVFYME